MMNAPLQSQGFTIIELLVVVTIIVVLLAMLTPAMDQAVYQAELALCASQQRVVASQSVSYAMDYGRRYPYRQSLDRAHATRWSRPNTLVDEGGPAPSTVGDVPYDDRPALYPYFGDDLQILKDPLTGGEMNFTIDDFSVFSDYMLWFGTRYVLAGGGKGLYRVGDQFEWTEDGVPRRLNVLVSDQDVLLPGSPGAQKAWSSHPDQTGDMNFLDFKRPAYGYLTWWERQIDERRGPVDTNAALGDLSVHRMSDVTYDDPRPVRVPYAVYLDTSISWAHVPGE